LDEKQTTPETPAAPASETRLPSDNTRPGDPRQVGFQVDPSEAHVERAALAAREVAELVSMSVPASARPLRVCFCLVLLPPRLPFNLFGFNVVGVEEDGSFRDEREDGGEIVYAAIVNQPVDLQRETMIAFLNDLVGRQEPLADIFAERRSIAELPEMTAAADAASAQASSDALRFSLAHAADALKSRASGLGYRLEVRFRMDPLPERGDVIRRMPLLRELYDRQEDVHAAVDSTIAMLGGQPLALRGGPEAIRQWTQGHAALLGTRQFMNQTLRDADVTGNGYLQSSFSGLDPTMRCLRPEDVEVIGEEEFRIDGEGLISGSVLHLRGLEQFTSPYGISPWEPLLYVLQRRRIADGAGEQMRAILAAPDASERVRERAQQSLRALAAIEADTEERLEKLLWYPRRSLGSIREDLYFSGQESFAR
jgi:hypothetical protein